MAVFQKRKFARFGRIKFLSLAFLFFLAFAGNIAITYAQTYSLVIKWGSTGSGNGQFDNPNDIAVDGKGYVYVTEYGNNRVQKFTSDGVFVTKWGIYGTGDGQFNGSTCIAVDNEGYVYVTDQHGDHVQKFTNTGFFVTKWGSYGAGDGQFSGPYGIAVDGEGYVYVADYDNSRVQKFTSDGVFVTKWGSYGAGDGQFNGSSYVAVDSEGYVYVSDNWNHRIQKFTNTGSFITQWGYNGAGDGQFRRPHGIAVDGKGYVYVADRDNSRVQKFTSDGVFVTKWGSYGAGDGQFNGSQAVAVDVEGNVYVVDLDNSRVQKFSFEDSEANNTLPVAIIIGVAASVFALSFFWWKKHKKSRTTFKSPSNPTQPVVLAPKSLNHVFISHVEEDTNVALEISETLEKAGYTTWCYENNSVPGPSYLLQTKLAVEQSQAVIVVISPNSLSSRQVTLEVVRAHESGKPFIPVLLGISHIEFQQRQPEWHEAIGSATSISIPKKGVSAIMQRIIKGLERLGTKKTNEFKDPST